MPTGFVCLKGVKKTPQAARACYAHFPRTTYVNNYTAHILTSEFLTQAEQGTCEGVVSRVPCLPTEMHLNQPHMLMVVFNSNGSFQFNFEYGFASYSR